jgi:hypothetical protein
VITLLYVVVALIALVLHIMLLIKLFQYGGALYGILGIICGLFAFIWGWMKCGDYGFRNLMIWLTIASLAAAVLKSVSVNEGARSTRKSLPERSY